MQYLPTGEKTPCLLTQPTLPTLPTQSDNYKALPSTQELSPLLDHILLPSPSIRYEARGFFLLLVCLYRLGNGKSRSRRDHCPARKEPSLNFNRRKMHAPLTMRCNSACWAVQVILRPVRMDLLPVRMDPLAIQMNLLPLARSAVLTLRLLGYQPRCRARAVLQT